MHFHKTHPSTQDRTVIDSGQELSAGDDISARYKGALVHRGQVTEVFPGRGLFWIMDELTGGRKLLDMAELEIVRRAVSPTQGAGAG